MTANDLYDYRWPASGAKGSTVGGVYILHGFGEYAGRYEPLARRLSSKGWRVAAHDHRGHGQSLGVRGRLPSAPSFAEDAIGKFRAFEAELGQPAILLGHSMGGMLAAELVLQHKLKVAGLVLSSPGLRLMLSRMQIGQLVIMSRLAPSLTMARPVDGRRLSHDLDQVDAYRSDPLIHGKVTAALVRWMLDSGRRSISAADGLDVDCLLMVAGADRVVDPLGSRAFAERAPEHRLQMAWFDTAFHELFNETPELRDPVLDTLDGWLARFARGGQQ